MASSPLKTLLDRFRGAAPAAPSPGTDVVVKAVAGQQVQPRTPDAIVESLTDSGMDNTANFGPGTPLTPHRGYSTRPRAMDYPVGVNISTMSRASWKRASFDTLQAIIDAYDVARMCINHKIDELRSMEPMFLPADGARGDVDAAIDAAKAVLAFPDRELPFDAWLHKWMESVLRYDAGTLYRRRNLAGDIIGLEALDGTTIAPYVDEYGRRPAPPAPAFYQLIHGQPWNWYTSDDIIYTPFRPQANNPYGLAPMESVLLTANTDLRFQWWFLQNFTEGAIPAAYGELPPDRSNPDQVAEWQDYWDAVIEGDQAQQHKVKWVPAGTKITAIQEHTFTSDFPEYLMSRTASAFGVLPQDLGLVKDVNRANGETQTDIQFRVNTLPWVRFVEGVLTRYLQLDLGLPVKLNLDTGRDKADRLQEAQAWKIYIEAGLASPDEGRSELLGLPIDNERPTPRFFNNSRLGPIPLLAIEGVAGKTDIETFGPSAAQPVLDQPFVGPIGVVPQPNTSDAAASLAATDAMQQAERASVRSAEGDGTLAQSQPVAPVSAIGKAAATEGVTTDTGIVGIDQAGTDDLEPDGDEPGKVEKEVAAFARFTKARRRQGKWRDFTFTAVTPVEAHRFNDLGRSLVRKDAGQLVAAGLCVRAMDSGRVLLLQRGMDPADPAAGMWEFPGGHIEDGEQPFDAAVREWQEETGCLIPAVALAEAYARFTSWTSPNGVYAGFVVDVASEASIDFGTRGQVTNPDDPDGDLLEAIAWWEPAAIGGNPVIRAELAQDLQLVFAALNGDLADADVAKASDAGPKASWRDSADKTPQHRFDLKITDHYAPKITEALRAAFPKSSLRAAVHAAAATVAKTADPALDALRNVALESLAGAGSVSDLEQTLRELFAEAFQSGAFAAGEQVGPGSVTLDGVDDVNWDDWQPGDAAASALTSDGALADLLDQTGTTIDGIIGSRLDQLGNAIGDGLARGDSIDTIAANLDGIISDPGRAEMIAHTETARAQSAASLATYAANGVGQWKWVLSDGACDECVDAADNGPYAVGDAAAPDVPLHPYCRCSTSPDSAAASPSVVEDVPDLSEPGE